MKRSATRDLPTAATLFPLQREDTTEPNKPNREEAHPLPSPGPIPTWRPTHLAINALVAVRVDLALALPRLGIRRRAAARRQELVLANDARRARGLERVGCRYRGCFLSVSLIHTTSDSSPFRTSCRPWLVYDVDDKWRCCC